MKNFYEILKVNKTATLAEIKTAFYKLSKLYHPDSNKSNTNEKFHEISKAYQILKEEKSRLEYDKLVYSRPQFKFNGTLQVNPVSYKEYHKFKSTMERKRHEQELENVLKLNERVNFGIIARFLGPFIFFGFYCVTKILDCAPTMKTLDSYK